MTRATKYGRAAGTLRAWMVGTAALLLLACGGDPRAAEQPIETVSPTTGGAGSPGPASEPAGQTARPASGGARAAAGGAGAPVGASNGGSSSAAGAAGHAAATTQAGASGAAGAAQAGADGAAGAAQAGAGGAAGSPGAAGAGGSGPSAGSVFNDCRFHFGTIADLAKDNPTLIAELDYFTPGWMGLMDTFDQQYVCDYVKAGGPFEGKVPVIVAYVAAFYAKRVGDLKDCNAPGPQQDLCVAGAQIITRDLDKIVAVYESYAQGYAGCFGTDKPIVFMMEPDFFQYTISNQSQPWTPQQAGQNMGKFVAAIKKHLPNAVFSMDISPWVPPNNGEDHGRQWFSNFDMSQFTFVHTSGGGTSAGTDKIRDSNNMTWRGVSEASGKPVLADTGYGVNGASAGHDPAWDDATNIKARIQDGVVSVNQYNPKADWANTIKQLRSQLGEPTRCP